MAGGGSGFGSAPVRPLPPPRPKSPPDLYGRRREMARLQMLEREKGFLEEELKFVEGLQPASRCCKEIVDFVTANADPLMPTNQKTKKSCHLWKWLCSSSCFSISKVCCCSGCSVLPKAPECCRCKSRDCSSCISCVSPKCSCWCNPCSCFCTEKPCHGCCGSCSVKSLPCSNCCSCKCKCSCPKCPSCSEICTCFSCVKKCFCCCMCC